MELRGGQRQVLYLARALERMRAQGEAVEAVVACPKGSPLAAALSREELPLVPLPGRGVTNPLLLYTVRKAIKERQIAIVHTHDARAATVGAWFKRMNNTLCLIHARRVSYPIRSGVRGKKYFIADAVVGVSREISQGMLQSGLPVGKVHTIHSGIDPTLYSPRVDRGDGRFVFGAIGALTRQKGFDVLIQAMTVLAGLDELPPWEVRLVGEGPLFTPLLEQAVAARVEDRLAMFGRQDSRAFLPDFDALLVPSQDGEGSNAVIKEGWAVGVPVVCSGLPSNEELVRDKESGLVVPVGNPLALGTAMMRLIKEPELRRRLTQGGTERLREFTDQRMAEQTLGLYRHTLSFMRWAKSTPEAL